MTTTSYAVLGLLCVQPWTAYELTGQMRRSLRFFWPRAESGIYREPQKLVDLGYATATTVAAGPRRTKQQYAATPAGRAALAQWLRIPSAPPQFESEAMVKFFFADQGELTDAQQALDGLAADADALWDTLTKIVASHEHPAGPFPQRQHIGPLLGCFVLHYAAMLGHWASWAREHVDQWPSTGPEAARHSDRVQREFAEIAQHPRHHVAPPVLPLSSSGQRPTGS